MSLTYLLILCSIAIMGIAFTFWAYYDIKSFLFALLVFKPLVDLTWNGPSIDIMGAKLNIQGGLALGTFVVLGTYVLLVERPKITASVGWLLAFAAVNCMSFLLGTKNGVACADFLRVISGIPILILGKHVFCDRQVVRRFTLVFLAVLIVPYSLAFLQHIGVIKWGYHTTLLGEEVFRITGGYMHPFGLSRYLYIAVPLIFLIWTDSKSLKTKTLLFCSFCLAGIFTVLTLFRMAILVFSSQCILWPWFRKKRFTTITCAFVLIVAGIISEGLNKGLFTEQYQKLSQSRKMEKVFNYRGAIWMGYVDLYQSGSNFQRLLGYGMYTDASKFQLAYNENLDISNDAHNDYIRILVENGLLGLICYLGFLLTLFSSIRKAVHKSRSEFARNYAIVAQIILISFLIMSITTRPTEEVTCFWYLLAVCSPIAVKSKLRGSIS